jgi:hypothetical protein
MAMIAVFDAAPQKSETKKVAESCQN